MKEVKREVIIFLSLLLIFSAIIYLLIFQSAEPNIEDSSLVLILVYTPFFAAIVTRLITERKINKLGWKFGNWKYLLIALLLPIIFGSVVYGFAYLTDIGTINENVKIGLGSDLPKSIDFIIFAVLGIFARTIGAFGEEVGWRGFLTPRLYKLTNITTASVIIGIIWFIWHIPLILMTDYGGELTLLKVIFSLIGLVAISLVLTWLRIKSGGLWIGVFYHASHNFFIQNVFDQLITEDSTNSFFLTEMGLGLCVVSVIAGFVFWKMRNKIPSPNDYIIS